MTEIAGQGDLLDLLDLLEKEEDGWVEFQCFECCRVWHSNLPPERWAQREARHFNGPTEYETWGCIASRRITRNLKCVQACFEYTDPLPGQEAAWVRTYALMRWQIAALRGHPQAQKHIQQLGEWLHWWDRSWFDGTPERDQRLRLQEAGHDFNDELGEAK